MAARDDTFELYDLRVEVVATGPADGLHHWAGDYFELPGENLCFPPARPSPSMPWPPCCRCCRPSSAPRIRTTG